MTELRLAVPLHALDEAVEESVVRALLKVLEPLPLKVRRKVLLRVLCNTIIQGTNPRAINPRRRRRE